MLALALDGNPRGRTLRIGRVVADGQPTVAIAHEALFRVWDTLHGWLAADRKALMLRAQIEDTAREWNDSDHAQSRRWWRDEGIMDAM